MKTNIGDLLKKTGLHKLKISVTNQWNLFFLSSSTCRCNLFLSLQTILYDINQIKFSERNRVFATYSIFLIPISLQLDGVNL